MSTIPYKQLKDENGDSFYPVCGASSFSDAVPITKGGTGADNAADALVNLGAVAGDGKWKQFSLSGNTASAFTIDRGYRGMFIVIGPDAGMMGIYGLYSTSGGMGSSTCKTMVSASSISTTTSGDTLTVTNSSASTAEVIFLTLLKAEPTR